MSLRIKTNQAAFFKRMAYHFYENRLITAPGWTGRKSERRGRANSFSNTSRIQDKSGCNTVSLAYDQILLRGPAYSGAEAIPSTKSMFEHHSQSLSMRLNMASFPENKGRIRKNCTIPGPLARPATSVSVRQAAFLLRPYNYRTILLLSLGKY